MATIQVQVLVTAQATVVVAKEKFLALEDRASVT